MSKGASWGDVLRWVWGVFGPAIKQAILPVLASGGVVVVAGREFVTSRHPVPGWGIVVAVGVAVFCVYSVGLNVIQWRRRTKRGPMLVIEHTGPRSLWWHPGKRDGVTVDMMSVGDFLITNRSPGAVAVPRSTLVVSYKRGGFLPARRHVDGLGVYENLRPHEARKERLDWHIEPPVLREGQPLVARVCLIDHLGNKNWTRWLRWPYLG